MKILRVALFGFHFISLVMYR